jgi:hypothetical protein
MNIGRTLFWFRDGDQILNSLNDDFFGVALLLNRLLNEKYEGKKIKFINLDFSTQKTYELYSVLPKDEPYYHGGHLRYYGLFDLIQYNLLSFDERRYFIWKKACTYIERSAAFMKNNKLLYAVNYAYSKGIEINLNPNYTLFNISINFSNQLLNASLWIEFKKDEMCSKLVIMNDKGIVFEREIDKTKIGVEFFLEMYKSLEFDGSSVLIKGDKYVNYLPLKISLPEFILN